MANLYSNHTEVSHTLTQFIDRANALYEREDTPDPFIRFAITGEYRDADDRQWKQVVMDPLQDMVELEDALTIRRDYDSLLGIASDIMVDGVISIFAVPHPTYALKSSIHIKHDIQYTRANGDIEYHAVEYHKIPNFEFGKFNDRHHLHIFFPGLWNPERGQGHQAWLTTEAERTYWFNNGLRPAILHLLGHAVASDWPGSYHAESARARNRNGGYSWGTRLVAKEYVPRLAARIRMEIQNSPFVDDRDKQWAQDFFILHTIRGTKHTSMHRVNAASAAIFLDTFIREANLSPAAPAVGDWYVDVAIEISSPDRRCLQWITSTHNIVVQEALRISDYHARRITELGSSQYARDPASHLTALSGFRATPGVQARGEFEVSYIQAYTTDKSVVSNKDAGHHAKFIETKEAMGTDHPTRTIEGLHTIYDTAKRANSSSARLEVRVPYSKATEVLVRFNSTAFRRCICSFTRAEWWSFRLVRLMAISQVFDLQAQGNSAMRVLPDALTLTAGCVWLLNGQHARPEDGPAARMLMNAILPVTEAADVDRSTLAYFWAIPQEAEEEEEDDDEGEQRVVDRVAYNPYGCVFLRRMMIGDVPRLRMGGPVLFGAAFKYWFKAPLNEIERKLHKTGVVDHALVARTRSTTSKSKMVTYVNWTGEPEPDLFHLGARGHVLPPPSYDDGSDVEERLSPPPDEAPIVLDTFASDLFRQFLIDIAANDVEKRQAREDIYQNLTLSDMWRAVAYKHGDTDDWARAFKWMFPKRGFETKSSVQWTKCPYFVLWLNFINDGKHSKELVDDTREAIWKRVRDWKWIPDAQQDKIWPTASLRSFTRLPPALNAQGIAEAAPRVLLRHGAVPIFLVDA
ncbi:hypothetical protein FPV67DRAFT_1682298 [Lyophyllum atratum]|nr:hypothetical protein FPV67DRAFT_1682298 [Lyophyllum atratum]